MKRIEARSTCSEIVESGSRQRGFLQVRIEFGTAQDPCDHEGWQHKGQDLEHTLEILEQSREVTALI